MNMKTLGRGDERAGKRGKRGEYRWEKKHTVREMRDEAEKNHR